MNNYGEMRKLNFDCGEMIVIQNLKYGNCKLSKVQIAK